MTSTTSNNDFWITHLDCPDYPIIQSEITIWLDPQVEYFKQRKVYFEHIDHHALLGACPSLVRWLEKIGTGPVRVAALILNGPNSRGEIHTDTQRNDLALNIGIQTEGTYTNLYTIKTGTPYTVTMPTGNTFTKYDKCEFEQYKRYEIVGGPIMFNTKRLHQVINPTNIWRLAISLRFEQDPWHLAN